MHAQKAKRERVLGNVFSFPASGNNANDAKC